MKKIWLLVIVILLGTTGCLKTSSMNSIDITASNYPIEYLTTKLYKNHSNIQKIYPDGTNVKTYKLTSKMLKDASKRDLFIYNGLSEEKNIATTLLSKNNKIKIIDATYGMNEDNGIEELWLNPSNCLMMAQNIKNGLEEYVDSSYTNKEIESNYKNLKLKLSKLDAEIKLINENANTKDLVVYNDSLKFLNKYGFNVYSLESTLSEKDLNIVRNLIKNGANVFMFENTKTNSQYDSLKVDFDFKNIVLKRVDNISEQDRQGGKDYVSLVNYNLDLLKEELYQ